MAKDSIYASKRNPCPNCGHDSGCKIFQDGKVWCLRVTHPLDVTEDWTLISFLRNGMGAALVPKTETTRVSPPKEDYQRLREAWKHQQKTQKLPLLETKDRDRAYRSIIRSLDLKQSHRQSLRDRGLTDSEIEQAYQQGWLRTWQPQQPTGVPSPYLAGIDPITRRLLGAEGFAIAALDPQGKITGFQIACDDRSQSKYLWLSSKKRDGNGPHLSNGELPLFVWPISPPEGTEDTLNSPQLPNAPTTIYLIEGALKSLLVALGLRRLGLQGVVIGTASAARYGQQTLEGYLKTLNAQTIVLLPDAGSEANPHIRRANRATLTLVEKWGYSVHVAVWGQLFDKSQPDFDELLIQGLLQQVECFTKNEYQKRRSLWAKAYNRQQLTSEDPHHLWYALQRGFQTWFQRLSKSVRRPRGFGQTTPSPQPSPHSVLQYKPGKLPLGRDIQGLPPKIIYRKGDRVFLWQEARLKGWQHILDRSAPGLGKSHDAGTLTPAQMGAEQIWYFTEQPRNVTTPTVRQSYTYLEPRHNGLVEAIDPNGQVYLRRPIDKEEGNFAQSRGNCHRTNLFVELYTKNITRIEGKDNPICDTCHLRYACQSSRGEGFGHRFGRYQTLQADKILAHLDSAPSPEEFNWQTRVNIYDESLRILNPLKTISVKLADVERVLAEIALKAPELLPMTQTTLTPLHRALSGKIALPRYGWNDLQVRSWLQQEACDQLPVINSQLSVSIAHSQLQTPSPLSPTPLQNSVLLPRLEQQNLILNFDQNMGTSEQNHLSSFSNQYFSSDSNQGLNQYFSSIQANESEQYFGTIQKLSLENNQWMGTHPHSHSIHLPQTSNSTPVQTSSLSPDTLSFLIQQLQPILQPDLSFLEEPESIHTQSVGREWKSLVRTANRHLRHQSYEGMEEQAQTVLLNWYIPLLEILSGKMNGSFHLDSGQLTIAVRNDRHSAIAQASLCNIYLDATSNIHYLSLWLNIDETEILSIEQEPPSYKNLEVIQITGLGLAGKQRSPLCDRRIQILIQQLRQEIPDLVVDDWKDKLPNEPLHDQGKARYLAKFRDTRGANYAKDAPAIASFGTPYTNLSYLAELYQILTKKSAYEIAHNKGSKLNPDSPLDQSPSTSPKLPSFKSSDDFKTFVNWTVQAEIQQTIGRLRSHLRPHVKLQYFFGADYDLSFLKNAGYQVRSIEAFLIHPDAGNPTQVSHWAILQGYQKAVEAGANSDRVTVKEIARHAHLSTGRVGQVASKHGGVKILRKILAALIESLKGGLKNSSGQAFPASAEAVGFFKLEPSSASSTPGNFTPSDLQWLAQTYLPLILELPQKTAWQELSQCLEILEDWEVETLVSQLLPEAKADLWSLLLPLLPAQFSELIRASI